MVNALYGYYLKNILEFSLDSEAAGLLVLSEVGLQGELLPAPAAAERLDVAVGLHVGPQVALVSKALAALVAAEWFLPCMSPDVSLQQPGPRERLPTERTLAARGVSPHVHAQGGWAAVLLAADTAGLGWISTYWLGLHCEVQGLTLLWPGGGGGG